MYLSRLILNPRHRDVQRDLANVHAMHRTVMSAFPDIPATSDAVRAELGVLHRVETHRQSGAVSVLVQSRVTPDWRHLPHGYLRDTGNDLENPGCRRIDTVYDALQAGMTLRFRLLANATKKLSRNQDPGRASRHGRRVDLFRMEEQLDWLYARAGRMGFDVLHVTASPGPLGAKRHGFRPGGSRMSFNAVLFDGRLQVREPVSFRAALESGIGPAKAYGFGMLSVAPDW